MKHLLLFILLTGQTLAGVSQEVFVRGKIGNDFNDKKIKVTDSLNQTYYLPRQVFPKDFNFQQGKDFAIEFHEKHLKGVKVLKK